MKKILLNVLFFYCFAPVLYAQQEDGVVSYVIPPGNSLKFNSFVINPTFSFVRQQSAYITLFNKTQWAGFDNAPKTYFLSYSGRFRENEGVAIGVFQQTQGVLSTTGLAANFAHNILLQEDNNLTFGINLSAYKSGLNTGKVISNFPDPSLDNIPSNTLLTISPGINYGTAFLDFGIAFNNLVTYNFASGILKDDPNKGIEGHVMYTGFIDSYGFFDKSKFSGLLKTEINKEKTIFSGSAMFTIPQGVWAQAGYNSVLGATAGFGLNITPKIALEYSYGMGLGDISQLGASHIIVLAYKLKSKNFDYGDDEEEGALIEPAPIQKKVVAAPKADTKAIADAKNAQKAKIAEANKAKLDAAIKAKADAAALAKSKSDAAAILNKKKLDADAKAKGDAALLAIKKTEPVSKEKLVADKVKADADAAAKLAADNKARADAKAKLLADTKAKSDAQATSAKLAADAKAKADAEAATAKLAADAKAKADAQATSAKLAADAKAKADAEAAAAKLAADTKAKADAQAAAEKLAAETKAKADAEAAAAKLAADTKAKADAQAAAEKLAAETKAKADAEAAKLAADTKAKADAQAAAEKLAAETKAKADAEAARLKLIADAKAKADAEAAAKAKADAQAEQDKIEAAAAAKLAIEALAKAKADAMPKDEYGKSMDNLTNILEDSKRRQEQLLNRLDVSVANKEKALKEMREENDLSDKGIVKNANVEFKSTAGENAELESIRAQIAEINKNQANNLAEFNRLYNERLKKTPKNDLINQNYLKTIETLKAEQAKAEQSNAALISNLEKIKVETEIEKKRRIKRAISTNDQDRLAQDMATLKQIKATTKVSSVPLKASDFDFGDNQANMQIIKNNKNLESGYYMILAVHSDVAKRDAFVTKTVAAGQSNVNFFYDVNSSKYFIYTDKFDTIQEATEALSEKGNKPYNGKMVIVKIEK